VLEHIHAQTTGGVKLLGEIARRLGTKCGYALKSHIMLNCPVALVVSSDRQVRRLISASLGQIGCTSLDVATGREGFECAGAAHVDLVIVDVCMPDGFETDMVRQLRAGQPDLKVLYLIGRASPLFNRCSGKHSTDAFLSKPFGLHELTEVVVSWLDESLCPLNASGLSLN
jgi:CheY-like chemotaxis protein